MFVIGDEIRFGGSGGIKGTVGSITALRGTWLRVVARLKPAGAGAGFRYTDVSVDPPVGPANEVWPCTPLSHPRRVMACSCPP